MVKYLGSKRTLVATIVEAVGRAGDARSVVDLFAGTSRVGHALKRAGCRVIANDHNAYAHTLARCYVVADRDELLDEVEKLVEEFNSLARRATEPGWFTHDYCERSRYFHPNNGPRIEAVRNAIAAKGLPPDLEAVMLTSLMEAADRVDSTTGVQMAYLKQWAARAHNPLELRVPAILPRSVHGKGEAHALDALDAVRTLSADVAYIDPPYNQHSYLGNYHVWETLVRWDEPEVYGIACKRIDCRERKSVFNSRSNAREAIRHILENVRARTLVVSFNDEGYIARADMESMLAVRGPVRVIENDYKRYVGAQIGIYNPQGEKVGKVGHLRNTEFLFIAGDGADEVTRTIATTAGASASP